MGLGDDIALRRFINQPCQGSMVVFARKTLMMTATTCRHFGTTSGLALRAGAGSVHVTAMSRTMRYKN